MPAADPSLPFSTWMEQALFAPQSGYYSARIRTVGRQGDFATSATVSPLLGEAIARWLVAEMSRSPSVRAVIEVGGGDGSLFSSVRRALGWWRRRSFAWHMVETSPVLRSRQQERLSKGGVHWHETMEAALTACGGQAFIFHNELVDAFPVTLLQWNGAAASWQEVWMKRQSSGWQEDLRPVSLPPPSWADYAALQQWSAVHPPPHPSQRVELHASFRAWLSAWAPLWQGGAMLTVDYGDVFPQVYRRRPQGTLRAYLLHQRLTGPEIYQNMGRQDITADVNFTDLLHWGHSLGWQEGSLVSQRQFLHAQLPRLERRLAASAAAEYLTDEQGAGEAFKVWTVRAKS